MQDQLQESWTRLSEKLMGWFDALILSLPNFLIATLLFITSYWLAVHIQSTADKNLSRFIKQASIRSLISKFLAVLIIIIGLLLSLSILNLDGALKSLLAGAGVAGLAISLALQGTLSNTFSGIFLALKKEVNIGDWLDTGNYSGKVVDIDLRNTKIKESDNNIVVIPNKIILDNPFKNYGLTQKIRCTINCGVSYDSDLAGVRDIAKDAISQAFPPDDQEQIEFYYTDFGGSSIDFMIRFWVSGKESLTALQVKSEAIMTLKTAFDQNKINIPFPIRTLISQN